jgi:ubiquinone/menaquinone biosynthesis C-methylase UbiE
LKEVARVLRPGGDFLFADLRRHEKIDSMREQLQEVFTIVEEECITPNVLRALELDSDRRNSLIASRAPRVLRPALRNFSSVKGTPTFEAFATRSLEYYRFVLRKRAE